MRVDGSHIQKENVADSKISGYVWTGPQFSEVYTLDTLDSVVKCIHVR